MSKCTKMGEGFGSTQGKEGLSLAISHANINTYTDPLSGIMVSNLHRSAKQYLKLWAAFIVGCENSRHEAGV